MAWCVLLVLGERPTSTWVLEGAKGTGKEQGQRTVPEFMMSVHSFVEEESPPLTCSMNHERQQESHRAGP